MIEQVLLWFLILVIGVITVAVMIYGFIQFLLMVDK